jgi:hypothetical protein
MAGDLLDRAEFNRRTAGMNNTYDKSSEEVLRADLKLAHSQNDPRAVASIERDLQRVSTSSKGGAVATEDTSPVPEARAALNQYFQLAPELESAIFSADKERTQHVQRATQAAGEAGAAQSASILAGSEAEIALQETHRQLLRAVGLDINNPESSINSELRRQTEARNQREAIDKEIVDLESTSFFQNPFAFLANQPKIQQLTAQYNNLARVENRSNEEIARMQTIADSVLKLTPAKNADLLRQKAAADATVAVKIAEARAAELSAQNSAGHAKALMDAFTARHNVFASMLQVKQLEEGILDRRASAAALQEEREWRRNDRRSEQEKKDAEKQRDTALVVGINTYRKAINGSAVPDFTLEDVKRMPAEIRGAWYEVIMRGSYGNNYLEAVPFIQRFGNPAAAAASGNAGMMQLIRNIEMRAQRLAPEIMNREKLRNPMAQIRPDQALAMAYNEIYAADAASAGKGADKSVVRGDSPYALDYDAAAAVAKLKPEGVVSKSLLAAKERMPNRTLNTSYTASMLLNEIEARVVSGEATPKQAAEEVSRFFATQSVSAYEGNGLKYLALPQPTDWVITPGGTGKAQLDLMNPSKVENYLTSRIVAEKRSRQIGTNNPFVPWR